jgi:hypothetical protein
MAKLRVLQQLQRDQRGNYVKSKVDHLQDQCMRNHVHDIYTQTAGQAYLRYICPRCLN